MEVSSESLGSLEPDSTADEYAPSRLECLGGVIVSPVRTFEHLASRPQWLFPLIVLVLWVLVGSVIRTSVISATAFASAMNEASGTGSQLPAMLAFAGGALALCIMLVVETGGAVAILLAAAAALYAITRAFKLRPSFYPLVSTLAYAEFLPSLVRTSLKEFIPLLTGNFGFVSRELPTGLLQILRSAEVPALLRPLLARIELFHLWSFVLVVISIRFVARASEKSAILITTLYWIVCIVTSMAATASWELISNALFGL
jgi:hypothetical protein